MHSRLPDAQFPGEMCKSTVSCIHAHAEVEYKIQSNLCISRPVWRDHLFRPPWMYFSLQFTFLRAILLTLNHADLFLKHPVIYIYPQNKASQHAWKLIYHCLLIVFPGKTKMRLWETTCLMRLHIFGPLRNLLPQLSDFQYPSEQQKIWDSSGEVIRIPPVLKQNFQQCITIQANVTK